MLFPAKLPIVRPKQKLIPILHEALQNHKFMLHDRDVLCIASKVVSTAEGRIVALRERSVSRRARFYAEKFRMSPHLAQVVIDEADAILGGVRGFLLTLKGNILTANAGVDIKNSPAGTATLWPVQPDKSAATIRRSLEKSNVRIGVIVVDSRVTPLRLGTTGLAIGLSGFRPIKDEREKPDLYRRPVTVTRTNLADDLAASAHLLMGERNERIGLVVVRNAPISANNDTSSSTKLILRECLIGSKLTGSANP
jgi:coenzyme F420-0:L-glutamate ligase/coenzyme F420-1:gamma-L-glutamate ligase